MREGLISVYQSILVVELQRIIHPHIGKSDPELSLHLLPVEHQRDPDTGQDVQRPVGRSSQTCGEAVTLQRTNSLVAALQTAALAQTDLDVVWLGIPAEHPGPGLAQPSLAPPVTENFGQERHRGCRGEESYLWNINQF